MNHQITRSSTNPTQHTLPRDSSVIILGAGLSGLYAAYLLKKHGVKATIVEARSRIGGRIHSIREPLGQAEKSYFDMGPAWFWPSTNPLFSSLVKELGLTAFEQYSQGNYLIDESMHKPPRVYPSMFMSQPSSCRLEGGMLSMAEALLRALDTDTVIYDAQVTRVKKNNHNSYQIQATVLGQPLTLTAQHIITTIPLKLLSAAVVFEPDLALPLHKKMQSLPTWMAAHAKIVAIYPTPFWRYQGYSGSAMSHIGPLGEIHDASTSLKHGHLGHGALFGFVGVSRSGRLAAGENVLKTMAIRQLTRIFGSQAADPLHLELLDWSAEQFTSTDNEANAMHPAYGLRPAHGGEEHPGLLFAGTEAAIGNGGYLEGALEAAETAVALWENLQGKKPVS